MKQRSGLYIFFSIVLLGITVLFSMNTMQNSFEVLDEKVQRVALSWTTPFLDQIMKGVTFLAYTKMLALLSALTLCWLLVKRLFYEIFLFLTIMGGGIIITFMMKVTIERDRPGDISYIDFWGLGADLISYSYPSGHAVKGFLFFCFIIVALCMKMKKKLLRNGLIALLIILIALIGIGQLMLNRHFMTDVIGGYLVGLTWVTICITVVRLLDCKNRIKNNSLLSRFT
jgi:undecaprenyl-diphosphatase